MDFDKLITSDIFDFEQELEAVTDYFSNGKFIADLPAEVWVEKESLFKELDIDFAKAIEEIAFSCPYLAIVVYRSLILGVPLPDNSFDVADSRINNANLCEMMYNWYFSVVIVKFNFNNRPINNLGLDLFKKFFPEAQNVLRTRVSDAMLVKTREIWPDLVEWIEGGTRLES